MFEQQNLLEQRLKAKEAQREAEAKKRTEKKKGFAIQASFKNRNQYSSPTRKFNNNYGDRDRELEEEEFRQYQRKKTLEKMLLSE